MTTVYLALGSNVGDAQGHIEQAIVALTTLLKNLRIAPLYLSKAIGYTDQADFVNTAISGQTDLPPEALLVSLKKIEQKIGRTATFRHGPREIDIDIIFYGDQQLQTNKLTIPHPAFRDRDFVLQPLADLDSTLIDPTTCKTVSQLLDEIKPSQRSILKGYAS